MSTALRGIRESQNEVDPEDARVGQTLEKFLEQNIEMSPSGYLIHRPITHRELAAGIGVSRQYISLICQGRRHMSDKLLFSIAKYLDVKPIQIKRPDANVHQQRFDLDAFDSVAA